MRKPDYRAINRAKEQRMAEAANANHADAWRRHSEITDREIQAGRAYERAAVAAAEREAERRKC